MNGLVEDGAEGECMMVDHEIGFVFRGSREEFILLQPEAKDDDGLDSSGSLEYALLGFVAEIIFKKRLVVWKEVHVWPRLISLEDSGGEYPICKQANRATSRESYICCFGHLVCVSQWFPIDWPTADVVNKRL